MMSYLFQLVAEVLAIYIRNDENINGIKINSIECKISHMADFQWSKLSQNSNQTQFLPKKEKLTSQLKMILATKVIPKL